jgi:hypothetical protein
MALVQTTFQVMYAVCRTLSYFMTSACLASSLCPLLTAVLCVMQHTTCNGFSGLRRLQIALQVIKTLNSQLLGPCPSKVWPVMIGAVVAGVTAPHPNAGCLLVSQDGRTISEAFQRAQVLQQMPLAAIQT